MMNAVGGQRGHDDLYFIAHAIGEQGAQRAIGQPAGDDLLLGGAGLTLDEIDFYLFTQLNLNTIKMIMEIIEQPLEKTHWIMDKWGYTGSACIPMALDDALERGKGPKKGDVVLFCASGGGISLACTVWRW